MLPRPQTIQTHDFPYPPTKNSEWGSNAARRDPLGEQRGGRGRQLSAPRVAPQVTHAAEARSLARRALAERWQDLITIQLRVYLSLPPALPHSGLPSI